MCFRYGKLFGRFLDLFFLGNDFAHTVRKLNQLLDFVRDEFLVSSTQKISQVETDNGPGYNLGIESLGGGDRHFNIASTTGVKDPVHFKGNVGIPPVYDRDGMSPYLANHIDRAIGIGGCSGLTYGNDKGVLHTSAGTVFAQFEPGKLGCF